MEEKLLERAASSFHIHNVLKGLNSNNVVDKDNSGPQIQGMETKAQLTSVNIALVLFEKPNLKSSIVKV